MAWAHGSDRVVPFPTHMEVGEARARHRANLATASWEIHNRQYLHNMKSRDKHVHNSVHNVKRFCNIVNYVHNLKRLKSEFTKPPSHKRKTLQYSIIHHSFILICTHTPRSTPPHHAPPRSTPPHHAPPHHGPPYPAPSRPTQHITMCC
jgi:hypothetical protein